MDYSYETSDVFVELLHNQIVQQSYGVFLNGVTKNNGTVVIHMSDELNSSDKEDLDSLVENHSQNYTSSFEFTMAMSRTSQEVNLNFGNQLLNDWMRKNIIEGMNIKQSLWVFSRFEDFYIDCDFGSRKVDIFKMFRSGAIPTAYFCLLQVDVDPMTEDYHWITQERIDWVLSQIEDYLDNQSPGMTDYIKSLKPEHED